MVKNGYMKIKDHTLTKHTILEKYLKACERFQNKYSNFCYIDTHGGSGLVNYKDEIRSGSPIIAAKIHPYPCHVIEIDPMRYSCLEESTKKYSHITVYHGDCNQKIDDILHQIPSWKFIFCFIDPDKLIYHGKSSSCLQLTYETVEKVAQHPKTEILLNFPLEALIRCGHLVKKHPEDARTPKIIEGMDSFFGTPDWIKEKADKKKYLNFYIKNRLESFYSHIGAICIRGKTRAPLYYLVYASNHPVGGKIMRHIMKQEWGHEPIGNIDDEFPIERFIFEPYSTVKS